MATAIIPDQAMANRLSLIQANELRCRLAKAAITVDKDTVIGDFTEADFGGYAAVVVSWGTIFIDGDGNAVSDATSIVFTKSGSSPTNTIYAWYLTNAAGSLLYAGRTLTSSVPMVGTDDQLIITLEELQGDLV